ncbi:uncharacterized protein LOC143006107 [Genypterus blacodes]|uniref:uncharacterized protein LOC143006107 n=1 Tax=Genypterus blacodes TaxID=154954 RepID=UPI003F762F02
MTEGEVIGVQGEEQRRKNAAMRGTCADGALESDQISVGTSAYIHHNLNDCKQLDLSPAVLNSHHYKASQFTGGSADDAKPPLYGNDFSALHTLKATWDTNPGGKTAWIDTFSPYWEGKYIYMRHAVGVVQPTLTLLPPSTEELQQGSATLVCVASGAFPPTWRLGWKVGGTSSSSVVSDSLEVLGRDGYYSWSSTLSLGADQWRKAGSVSCEASLTGQSPVTQTLDPDHCSQ